MFGYAPTVQDRSGELQAAGIEQGASGIAGGINTASQTLGTAFSAINDYHQKHLQALGTAGAAHSLGLINDDQLAQFNQMQPQQQMGFAGSITPLIQAKGMAAYHSGILDLKQSAQDAKGAGGSTMTELYPMP